MSALAPGTCVIDFLRPELPGEEARYGAFVVERELGIVWVDLGPASDVDAAIADWRAALLRDEPADAARQLLRTRLWHPLEVRWGPQVSRVFVAPVGPLCQLPWSALPGREPDRVLLEDYTLGLVPYGAFLADRAPPRPAPAAGAERWLLVGHVDYDRRQDVAERAVPAGEKLPWQWPPLPFTQIELEQVAGLLPPQTAVARLEGARATTDRLLQELARCQRAHLATHAFYANPRLQAELGIATDEARRRLALRHPLLLNGLALAGANLGPGRDSLGLPTDDGGLLTGNVIAHLPLSHLELVVLSGCETGAGVTGGDGAVGLQRAFHLAGARNVVASLWPVDDQGTAALMKLFYYYQYREGLTPHEALRQAQLALLRNPHELPPLAQLRGPNFQLAAQQLNRDARPAARLSPRHWAGFMLSGLGE